MLEEKIGPFVKKMKQDLELATMNLTAWEVKTTKLRIELDEAKKKVRLHQDKLSHIRGALCMCEVILEKEAK